MTDSYRFSHYLKSAINGSLLMQSGKQPFDADSANKSLQPTAIPLSGLSAAELKC